MPGRPRPHGHQDAAGRQYLSVGDLPIGQVAKRAGVGVQTVRYYERRGRRRLPIELLVIGRPASCAAYRCLEASSRPRVACLLVWAQPRQVPGPGLPSPSRRSPARWQRPSAGWCADALRSARPAGAHGVPVEVARALILFGLAGLAEIGGGWLVWQWLRESKPWPVGLAGALVLVAYGVIPTFQTDPHFGRVYAAFGGVFIVIGVR